MTSKTAILAAAVSGLFVLAGPAFSADDGSYEKCFGVGKAAKSDRAELDQIDGAVHVIAA